MLAGFFVVSLLTTGAATAQTYQCKWVQIAGMPEADFCGSVPVKSCPSGYKIPPCNQFLTQPECERERQCEVIVTPRPCEEDTAIGRIPVCDLNDFATWFLKWAIGIGGGIAFLLILWSGFQIMTSAGNPERLKVGKEQLTAALTGLLFLIFSVFLLRLIGVEILRIPGLQ